MRRWPACAAGVLWLSAAVLAQGGTVAVRVYDGARGVLTDFDTMVADISSADVVFVGEEHDSRNAHRLELSVLEGLARRQKSVVVAMEMFERDVQEPLDHFLMGHTSEDDFLRAARPWPNYATDYKPLVEFAIAHNWDVVGSNVPERIAAEVAKSGLEVLQTKSPDEQKWFAHDLRCPLDDDYFKRFAKAMRDHPVGSADPGSERQALERMYFAQCLRDETMGESVALAYNIAATGTTKPLVVHFNGTFHSDFGEGAAERARRRLPGRRVVVLSVLPVARQDAITPDASVRARGDYLLYTLGDLAGS